MIINRLPDNNLIIFSGFVAVFFEAGQFPSAAECSPLLSIEDVSGIGRIFTGICSGDTPHGY